MKSTICHSSPISCAAHSHTVLLTQNKDGLVSLFVKEEIRFRLRYCQLQSAFSGGMSHLWSLRLLGWKENGYQKKWNTELGEAAMGKRIHRSGWLSLFCKQHLKPNESYFLGVVPRVTSVICYYHMISVFKYLYYLLQNLGDILTELTHSCRSVKFPLSRFNVLRNKHCHKVVSRFPFKSCVL